MKFGAKRIINLSKFYKPIYGRDFDRDLHSFETDEISITDSDSMEEAWKKLDMLEAERNGYWKARIEAQRKSESPGKQANGQQPILPTMPSPIANRPIPTNPTSSSPNPNKRDATEETISSVPPGFNID